MKPHHERVLVLVLAVIIALMVVSRLFPESLVSLKRLTFEFFAEMFGLATNFFTSLFEVGVHVIETLTVLAILVLLLRFYAASCHPGK